ncbi:MAG TPA: GGDEF domain-containing protein [Xanthobacteraceae bacterium]|jgi:diguanylate cyclase (GGDEF)-like protein|nr:GGDEF domain-containing protein [Xanthobacteraceae bacterium]
MLHVPTLAAIAVFVTAILGGLLMLAWRREQNSSALLWWGAAYVLAALSFALVSARGRIPDVLSTELGNSALLLGYAVLIAGTRAFNGRETPPTVFLIAPLIWLTAMRIPAVQADIALRIIIITLCQCGMMSYVIYEFWRERAEPLLSRWPTIVVLVSHLIVLGLRLPAALLTPMTTTADFFQSPTFGVMVFVTVLYTITFAFLLLSMVKERGELRHKTAALIDPLTGLANRRAFLGDAEHFMALGPQHGESLTVMLADLDRFKAVNDQFGHAVGDRVLQIFAETITGALRATDLSGRLGGEEFAFLMPRTNAAEAQRIAERIRIQFAEAARKVDGDAVDATVSVGVATATMPAQLSGLVAAADDALYRAKAEGRNRVMAVDCAAPAAGQAVVVPIRARSAA